MKHSPQPIEVYGYATTRGEMCSTLSQITHKVPHSSCVGQFHVHKKKAFFRYRVKHSSPQKLCVLTCSSVSPHLKHCTHPVTHRNTGMPNHWWRIKAHRRGKWKSVTGVAEARSKSPASHLRLWHFLLNQSQHFVEIWNIWGGPTGKVLQKEEILRWHK